MILNVVSFRIWSKIGHSSILVICCSNPIIIHLLMWLVADSQFIKAILSSWLEESSSLLPIWGKFFVALEKKKQKWSKIFQRKQ